MLVITVLLLTCLDFSKVLGKTNDWLHHEMSKEELQNFFGVENSTEVVPENYEVFEVLENFELDGSRLSLGTPTNLLSENANVIIVGQNNTPHWSKSRGKSLIFTLPKCQNFRSTAHF